MRIILLLIGLFLGFWGFMVVINGALGAALMAAGAIFVSTAFIISAVQAAADANAESADQIRQLLVEIRDQAKRPAAEPAPATEFDAAKVVDEMQAARAKR